MKNVKSCLSLLFLTLACSKLAFADGVIRDGLGARVAGRGGTNIAFADNGAILYDNPAGMANMVTDHLSEVAIDVLISDFKYADPTNDTSAYTKPIPLGHASFIKSSADGVFAYGLGVFAPAGFGAEYDLQGPIPFPGVRRYKSFGALGKILPGISCRVTDRLSVGATLGVAVSHVELEGPYFLQSAGPLQSTPMLLKLQTTGAAPTWSFGIQYELSEATTLGLAYQSETRLHLRGNTTTTVFGVGTTALDTRFDITWPRSLGLGVKHEICCHQIVSADVIWFNWSNAFDQFGVRFTNPTNPAFVPIIGSGLNEGIPLNWRDTVSIRLGYERHLDRDRVLRLGYVGHNNPIPASTQTPYIQAILEHNFTIGYGFNICDWETDLAYQYTFGGEKTVGTSGLIGGDFNSSRNGAKVHAVFLSFLRRF